MIQPAAGTAAGVRVWRPALQSARFLPHSTVMRGYGETTRRIRWRDEVKDDLVVCGEIAQGVLDVEFHANGDTDRWTPLHQAALKLVLAAARGECVSRAADDLERVGAPAEIDVKLPEGFAFYAVYPQLYARAARTLPAGRYHVIGIRAIGTALGAAVASAVHAIDFTTVRPIGHPFHRALSLDDAMRARLTAPADAWLIVDEGPGLSGSSFGCVADFLEENGVPRARIVFFPSHPNELGAQADPRHRERWRSVRKCMAGFEPFFREEIVPAAEACVGPFDEVIDIGAGGWRKHIACGAGAPSTITRERRKYLCSSNGKRWLLKFSGLGGLAGEKLDRARALDGITPSVAGVANGFLVQEWIDGRVADARRDRASIERALEQYLPLLPRADGGEPLDLLVEHARTTIREITGVDWTPALPRQPLPVAIDNRLHAWEWVIDRGGRAWKCDALDHANAHDGIGPQDSLWDVAGASVELGIHLAGGSDFEFYRQLYLAAQCSWIAQLAPELESAWPGEAARLRELGSRYRELLRESLSVNS